MAKKNKITLSHSDDMEEIDAELTAALNALEGKNQQVVDLLRSYDAPVVSETREEAAAPPEPAQPEAACGDGKAE